MLLAPFFYGNLSNDAQFSAASYSGRKDAHLDPARDPPLNPVDHWGDGCSNNVDAFPAVVMRQRAVKIDPNPPACACCVG